MAGGLLVCCLMSASALAATDAVPARGEQSAAMDTLYGQRIDTCLGELGTLRNVDQAGYERQSRALNAEIARATRYLLQRDQLNPEMRSVLDRQYQARLTSQCQSVHNTLFDVLLGQASGADGQTGGGR